MSLFFKSNESRLRKFRKDGYLKEVNEEAQQQVVDDEIAERLGLEKRISKLALLTQRVNEKLKEKEDKKSNILLDSINGGTLDNLIKKLKNLPDSSLTKTQKIIRDDLKNPDFIKMMNESIFDIMKNGPQSIYDNIIENLAGYDENNKKEVLDLIEKANKSKDELVRYPYIKKKNRSNNMYEVLRTQYKSNASDAGTEESETVDLRIPSGRPETLTLEDYYKLQTLYKEKVGRKNKVSGYDRVKLRKSINYLADKYNKPKAGKN